MTESLFAELQTVQDKAASGADMPAMVEEAYTGMDQTKCRGGGPGEKCGGLPSVEFTEENGQEAADKPPMTNFEDIMRGLKPEKDATKEIDPEDVTYIADLLTEHGDFRNDFKRGRVEEILGEYAEIGNVKRLVANINKELGKRGSDLHIEYDSKHDDGNHGFYRSEPTTTHTLSVIKPGEEEPEDVVGYVEKERTIRGL